MNGSHSGSAALQVDHLILQGEASAEEMRGFGEGAAARARQRQTKCDRSSHLTGWRLGAFFQVSACLFVWSSRCYGRRRQWQEILLDSESQKVSTDWPADWLAGWLASSLGGWQAANASHSKIIRPESRLDGLDNYRPFDGWRLQTVIRLGNREFGWCGGGVAQTLCANVLLTRLKQHDHPLGFLSCILR